MHFFMVPCHSCSIYGAGDAQKGSIGGGVASHKRGTLFIGKEGSHYVILLYCETLLQVLRGIYCKIFYSIPLFTILLLFYVFEVGKAKSATQSVLMILTLNSVSLTLPLVFFHYSVCTVISDCNHPFDTSTFTHSLTRIHLLQLKIHIWMEFFWNQKFLFFHKRNFSPKVINYF